MLQAPIVNEWLSTLSSIGADGTRPLLTQGTFVNPGASSTYGAYVSLGVISPTIESHWIEMFICDASVSASNRMVMLTWAIDPAGGTSFVGNEILVDHLIGSPGQRTVGGNGSPGYWTFPLRIPAGATIGVKAASLDATTTAFSTWVNLIGAPTRPELHKPGAFIQTFGVPSSPTVAGTVITPGTTAEGAWAEIGTLDKRLFYFDFGISVNDTTITGSYYYVDIGIGDASNKRIIIPNALVITSSSEAVTHNNRGVFAHGAIGDKIYARAQYGGVLDTNVSVAVYGVG